MSIREQWTSLKSLEFFLLKRFEEFRPTTSFPLRFPNSRGALRLLTRFRRLTTCNQIKTRWVIVRGGP
jgi:hypothetical protein